MAIEYVQVALENQLCHWAVTAMQSFVTIKHNQLIKLISLADPNLRDYSRQTISRRLKTICDNKKLNILSSVKMDKCRVSVAADAWSSQFYKGYIVVTGHWIESD